MSGSESANLPYSIFAAAAKKRAAIDWAKVQEEREETFRGPLLYSTLLYSILFYSTICSRVE